jgi:hypothetical protein
LRYDGSVKKLLGKLRIRALSIAAVVVQAIKLTIDHRIFGRSADVPNYTLLEPGLYIGGYCLRPPPETRAVLSLTPMRDAYCVEISEWLPLQSGSVPTIPWLQDRVQFIDTQRLAGRTVFVHCDAGIDRSGMVVVAYFMWRDRRSRDEALEFVQRKRPIVRPNPVFMQLLRQWESVLLLPHAPCLRHRAMDPREANGPQTFRR